MIFAAPVKDLMFHIAHIAPWPGEAACDLDIAAAVPKEFGRFYAEEIDPLNASGKREGSRCVGGQSLSRSVGAAATEISRTTFWAAKSCLTPSFSGTISWKARQAFWTPLLIPN